MKRIKEFCRKQPFLAAVLFSVITGIVCMMASFFMLSVGTVWEQIGSGMSPGEFIQQIFGLVMVFPSGSFVGLLVIFPAALTLAELVLFIQALRQKGVRQKRRLFDLSVIWLGPFYSYLYLSFLKSVLFSRDWDEVLVNAEVHTPIYTGAVPTLLVIAVAAMAGYGIVHFIPLEKMPPLLMVIGLAAMYLGTLESILWLVQIGNHIRDISDLVLILFPLDCVLLTAGTVIQKVQEWKRIPHAATKWDQVLPLRIMNRFLERSERWPLAAFVLMWPLLGIVIGLLTLFGQTPDAVIRAWTETGEWSLSRRVSPQNVYYDEHYLCTVAAGGHDKIVRPLRMGVRHGHEVIVNRQLCVANAFEQVLEERTPRFHRAVRNFYDTYGFPVARMIRSKYAADAVYVLMKPLEWIFLTVLYLVDANPENRIAIQYTGRKPRDFDICRQ